ncbi:DUF421 domain-containing protein [Paenibacillus sp. GCM10023248]|uniref:DUF421 domain-containing protein n=1 Tax=Bacillales TaxID=1385 RepID=UPI002378FD5C|nr:MULTISPECIES: YetF domain-containing protein [Bacillales]MDD9269451.1 DUF421 domain-containing protein [Paenibacillus sp. MAHUQ-63]MDR6880933.1 uncharacterized membrane protein YcaP (DUF421 family) [Bacillus sp. 3255]
MDLSWHLVWKCILLVLTGILLLRLSGRKSIAQMNVATTVIMISIGELIAQGIIENTVWRAIAAVALFLATLVILEFLEIRFGKFQNLITGEAVVIIREGQLDMQALKKLRITVNQLEMRLRQLGISSIADIKHGAIETNGELGYELQEAAKPVTKRDLEVLLKQLGNK